MVWELEGPTPTLTRSKMLMATGLVVLGVRQGQQAGIAADRGGIDAQAPLGHEAVQVGRPAGFRAGPGEPAAAEGLYAHHGADDVAVHIDVPGARFREQLAGAGIDAAVDAEGERVTGLVDLLHDAIDVARGVPDHVQDRAEDLAFQLAYAVDLDHGG